MLKSGRRYAEKTASVSRFAKPSTTLIRTPCRVARCTIAPSNGCKAAPSKGNPTAPDHASIAIR